MTEINFFHLFIAFFVLMITFKVIGGILFWLVSFILGNKLAEMLENDNDPPARQRRPYKSPLKPREPAPALSNRHRPTYHE